ncbi:MAG TPA: ankyrin repeat domain-containing protein [Chthonomonadaceae bacterium]|nr:ankyrin repeat domain-containing protein [Chthonomonadaceae bacterium]
MQPKRRKWALLFLVVFVGVCTTLIVRTIQLQQADKALLAAIKCDDTPAVLAALHEGADPNVRDFSGGSPLSLREDWERFLAKLRQHDARLTPSPYPTALMVHLNASHNDNPTLVTALLDAGADPNLTGSEFEETPLMWAANRFCPQTLHILLAHGGRVNQKNTQGETPLSYAFLANDVKAGQTLLDTGADIHDVTVQGQTLAECAVENNRPEMLAILLPHHPNRSECSTLLDWVISEQDCYARYDDAAKDYHEVISLLRQAGAKTSQELDASAKH